MFGRTQLLEQAILYYSEEISEINRKFLQKKLSPKTLKRVVEEQKKNLTFLYNFAEEYIEHTGDQMIEMDATGINFIRKFKVDTFLLH